MKNKILIIGQGLAGTVLAFTLMEDEKNEVIILDNNPITSSSKVAGGLFNPIVFKRLMHSWNANILIPKLKEYYLKIGNLLEIKLIYNLPIYKILPNEDEKQFWLKKSKQVEMWDYLAQDIIENYKEEYLEQYSGFAEVYNSGYIDLKLLLSKSREYFINQNMYIESTFDFTKLKIDNNKAIYENQIYDYIIFAEGYKAQYNPYFNWLPYVPAKGEVLTLKIENYNSKVIINKNIGIVPIGNDLYKIVATYNWTNLNEDTTIEAKEELISKLKEVLKTEFVVINQESGIRPSVLDRRPIIGNHPNDNKLLIFNGLGTKGVMLAPYVADILKNNILYNLEINSEINISRFYKYYPDGYKAK